MNNVISIFNEEYEVTTENRYSANNAPVLEIFEKDTGMPSGVISICIPHAELEPNETALINIEAGSLVNELVKSGIAVNAGKTVRSGYAEYSVVEVTIIN